MDQLYLKLAAIVVLIFYLFLHHQRRAARRRAWRRLRTQWNGRVLEGKSLIRHLERVRDDYQGFNDALRPPGPRSRPVLSRARVRRLAFFRGRKEREKIGLPNQREAPPPRPIERQKEGSDAAIPAQFQPAPA